MRQEWGVTYFKLDANFWGAMHGGKLYDPKATRIEAYRRGMQAILRGAGDSFILGCNHPIWASFGLIHGSRSSGDIKRTWDTFQKVARQNLNRNWQNGKLWWNDPDAVTLSGSHAARGVPLSCHRGHGVRRHGALRRRPEHPPRRPPGDAEEAAAAHRRRRRIRRRIAQTGTVKLKDRALLCLFNWSDNPAKRTVQFPRTARVTDLWSGRDYGRQSTVAIDLAPHEATVLVLR